MQSATSRPLSEPPLTVVELQDKDPSHDNLKSVVGLNLRRLRQQRGLSLERLAKASGVSRAMLGQIGFAHSIPTITVLWKIARTLDVPLTSFVTHAGDAGTTLLRRRDAKVLASSDGSFRSRPLFPLEQHPQTEFYELRLAAGAVEQSLAHPAGTRANLVVTRGHLRVALGHQQHLLAEGDALVFAADVPVEFFNTGSDDAIVYLVLVFPFRAG